MKNTIRILVLALATLGATVSLTPMTGCSFFDADTPPSQQLRDYGALYLAAVNTLNTARASGRIDADIWRDDINPVIQEGRAIYNDWFNAIAAGETDRIELLEVALSGIVSRLNIYAAEGSN